MESRPQNSEFRNNPENFHPCLYRESYMSAHVLLNLLNELGKRNKMQSLPDGHTLNTSMPIFSQHNYL